MQVPIKIATSDEMVSFVNKMRSAGVAKFKCPQFELDLYPGGPADDSQVFEHTAEQKREIVKDALKRAQELEREEQEDLDWST